MRRFKIRGLMMAVVATAVSVAALRDANDLWAGVFMLFVAGLLGAAILGSIHLRDRAGAWWLGFAIFEAGYLIIAFGMLEKFGEWLPTGWLIAYVHNYIARPPQQAIALDFSVPITVNPAGAPSSFSGVQFSTGVFSLGGSGRESFTLIGHCIFAVLAGFLGAWISCRFQRNRRRAEAERPFSGN
jgi:hypothetical protein